MKPKVSEPHPTMSGWCCACDVDQMTYRGMLKEALDTQKQEMVEIVRMYFGSREIGDKRLDIQDDIINKLESK